MTFKQLTTEALANKVVNKDKLFIFDVRNESDFNDWKVEGENIEYLNVPYFDLLEGIDSVKNRIPKDGDIIVICAKGGSSEFVAGQLFEAGFEHVYSVTGGMKAWSEHLRPVKVGELRDGGELYQFVRVGKGCLSYMAVSNGEAVIIDATRMTNVYLEFAKKLGASIKHVFDTHLHADHISGGREIAEMTNATYWLPPKDAADVQFSYEPLEEGTNVKIGHSTIKIQPLYSPGHTIGSTSFVIDEAYLLSGDILFIDSIGRPDLAGQAEDWVNDLHETLFKRYRALSNDLIVLPAHFMLMDEVNADGSVAEKLGTLLERNHGLTIKNQDEFRKLVTENLPPQPNAYQEIRETNMGKITPNLEKQREMEIGPNRCAVR